MLFIHRDVNAFSGDPQLQGHYQDTTYYLMPAKLLPLLIPLSKLPLIGYPLARALDPPLRVLVEAGYDRTINPGQPTPAKYLYFSNPIRTLVDFAVAIPTGWDDAITSISGNPADRPFRTAPQPTYGVGGPPVYAGAVDAYGPVDPSVTVAGTDAAPAAAQYKEIRTNGRLATPTAALRQGMKTAASASAQPVRKPRLSPESAGGTAEQSQPDPSMPRVRRAGAA